MVCERCGTNTYPLSWCPTKVSLVTKNIKDGEWVCKNCYTPEEKKFILKQEMLRRIQSASPLTIYDTDIEWAWNTLSKFKCPRGREPTRHLSCRNCTGDIRDKCQTYLQASLCIHYVIKGKVKVVNLPRPWEAPV